jgi:hypothetical protein
MRNQDRVFRCLLVAGIGLFLLAPSLTAAQETEGPTGLPEVTLPTLPELPAQAADAARSALDTALDRAEQALSGEHGKPEVALPELPTLPDSAADAAHSALSTALDQALEAAANGLERANAGGNVPENPGNPN